MPHEKITSWYYNAYIEMANHATCKNLKKKKKKKQQKKRF